MRFKLHDTLMRRIFYSLDLKEATHIEEVEGGKKVRYTLLDPIGYGKLCFKLRDSQFSTKYKATKRGVEIFFQKETSMGYSLFFDLNFVFPFRNMICSFVESRIERVHFLEGLSWKSYIDVNFAIAKTGAEKPAQNLINYVSSLEI